MLAVWAADCAERTLPLFEARAPSDTRPRDAIDGLRAFARGDMRIGELHTLSAQAHAAARETDEERLAAPRQPFGMPYGGCRPRPAPEACSGRSSATCTRR